ncbi:MAG: hypothetical protein IH906_07265, partial [Proteobacteria bacterium]|nr:hypothetical protein [Pseudomonadota bacterium]
MVEVGFHAPETAAGEGRHLKVILGGARNRRCTERHGGRQQQGDGKGGAQKLSGHAMKLRANVADRAIDEP